MPGEIERSPHLVETGRFHGPESGKGPTGRLEPNRGGLILFLGITSLLFCWPFGIAAWVLGNSDIRRTREGRMSATGIRAVKAGRALGIVGTSMFCFGVAIALVYVPELVSKGAFSLHPDRLPVDQLVYAGEWIGEGGTLITIHPDGKGDFLTVQTTFRGGNVRIDGDTIAIGAFGFHKSWNIDEPPSLKNGKWHMILDGEVFVKEEEGLLVSIYGDSPA
ncbi:MAG: hypothetical protein V2B18_00745 [Pseudomonadota bacterium]